VDETQGETDELIGADEASRVLEVQPDRIDIMVAEGMLSAVEGPGGPQFRRAEVMALRQQGG